MPPRDLGTGLADFDFLIGPWRVHHRRLKDRLVGSNDWLDFEGTTEARKILGGAGNMDDNTLDLPGGAYHAVSLRTFNPGSREWAIWWVDGRRPGHLDPPVVGRFSDGIGSFFADDTLNGIPIRVRFVWSHIAARSCRWEQAFSADGGATWETNWVMEFARDGTG